MLKNWLGNHLSLVKYDHLLYDGRKSIGWFDVNDQLQQYPYDIALVPKMATFSSTITMHICLLIEEVGS